MLRKTQTQATKMHTRYSHLQFETQNAQTHDRNEEQNAKRNQNATCQNAIKQRKKTLHFQNAKRKHANR